jgi:hypothetical protein
MPPETMNARTSDGFASSLVTRSAGTTTVCPAVVGLRQGHQTTRHGELRQLLLSGTHDKHPGAGSRVRPLPEREALLVVTSTEDVAERGVEEARRRRAKSWSTTPTAPATTFVVMKLSSVTSATVTTKPTPEWDAASRPRIGTSTQMRPERDGPQTMSR